MKRSNKPMLLKRKNKMNVSFRDKELALNASKKIKELAGDKKFKFMHVCGTHEDTITRYGIRSLLPEGIEVISGPGCPVCVTTAKEIDEAHALADSAIITTFGDLLKVPGSRGKSLRDVKAGGKDVRVVYSISDAVKIAKSTDKEVVHIGIGFETTAPSTAAVLNDDLPENFSVLSCHRIIPPAMDALLSPGEIKIDGFIDPGHVSTIIGVKAYEPLSEKYGVPQVIAGFEPLDVLFGIVMLLEMIENEDFSVRNEYSGVVRYEGNLKAQRLLGEIFDICDVAWRGFPVIPKSGLELKKEFSDFNARKKFDIKIEKSIDIPEGCRCGDVLKGLIYPDECKLFCRACNPEHPVGACMVSNEGSCAIWHRYGGKFKF